MRHVSLTSTKNSIITYFWAIADHVIAMSPVQVHKGTFVACSQFFSHLLTADHLLLDKKAKLGTQD